MFDRIRMDIYRMFRSKSFYILLFIMSAVFLMTMVPFIAMDDTDMSKEAIDKIRENLSKADVAVDLGGNVEKVIDISEYFEAILGGLFGGLFAMLFAAIFCSAEFTSGFIKNIAGQAPKRLMLVVSRSISLLIYNVLFFAYFFVFSLILNIAISRYILIEDIGRFFKMVGAYFIMYYGLELLIMMISYVTHTGVLPIIFAVLISTEMAQQIILLLQMACRRFISKDIEIVKYTLTANVGKVSDLVAQNKSLATGLVIAVVYIAVSIAISMLSIEKKDVV